MKCLHCLVKLSATALTYPKECDLLFTLRKGADYGKLTRYRKSSDFAGEDYGSTMRWI